MVAKCELSSIMAEKTFCWNNVGWICVSGARGSEGRCYFHGQSDQLETR